MLLKKYQFENNLIEVQINFENIKNLYIGIRKNTINCRAPKFLPMRQIDDFIEKHIGKLAQKLVNKKELITQDYFYFLGQKIKVLIMKRIGPSDIEYYNNALIINTIDFKINVIKVIKKWLLKQSYAIILPMVREYEQKMQTMNHKVIFNFNKTRLGVNNLQNHEIRLSVHMLQIEKSAIEYLIVHELAHDFIAAHSTSFWKIVDTFCLDRKQIQKKVKSFF